MGLYNFAPKKKAKPLKHPQKVRLRTPDLAASFTNWYQALTARWKRAALNDTFIQSQGAGAAPRRRDCLTVTYRAHTYSIETDSHLHLRFIPSLSGNWSNTARMEVRQVKLYISRNLDRHYQRPYKYIKYEYLLSLTTFTHREICGLRWTFRFLKHSESTRISRQSCSLQFE